MEVLILQIYAVQHQQHLKVAVPSTNYSQAVLRGEDPVLEEENTVTWPTG